MTSGVVTAAYPSGGFNGFYLQTPGTGGDVDLASHDTSDAVFVFLGGGADPASYPAIGDHVQVTGPVSEYAGMTEVSPAAGGVSPLAPADAPTPPRWPTPPPTRAASPSRACCSPRRATTPSPTTTR